MLPAHPRTAQRTVLVAEDDDLVRVMTTNALMDAGFDVIGVGSAEEALGLAVMDVRFDALFTSIELGGALDGWELAESMREMRPAIPVFYACANAEAEHAPMRVPDSQWVTKPYSPLAVSLLMRTLLDPPRHTPDIMPAAPVAEASRQECVILPLRPRKVARG
jgi:CheY-like chemotaxis protein